MLLTVTQVVHNKRIIADSTSISINNLEAEVVTYIHATDYYTDFDGHAFVLGQGFRSHVWC